ncbi:hypothetical protein ACFVFS_06245 [Kitasatospora sp. NPDC057692]|uniref:hypothetical protein n=1 Tax=Kitasatospora sp. NPDC057692 TaxID=3346215 RepID=UPI003674A558
MEIIAGAGLAGRAWPELLPDRRPALVVPAWAAGPAVAGEGWSRQAGGLEDGPAPGWSAAAAPPRLTVRRPAGQPWFDARVTAGREWWRALRAHGALLLVTGPFTDVFDLRPAAEAGALTLLTVDAAFTSGP